MNRLLLLLCAIVLTFFVVSANRAVQNRKARPPALLGLLPSPTALPTPTPTPIPTEKILDSGYHIFQSFNNCGPASLSMALSYHGISRSQEVLGEQLRPYQIPNGDNDDKSVTLSELAAVAPEYGLHAYHRPNGNPKMLRNMIAFGLPVLVRTWTKPGEDIGHFRLVRGYDHVRGTFIQDDSLQGRGRIYTYADFDELWQAFNYEFLVLVPDNKRNEAEVILGTYADERTSWIEAALRSQNLLSKNPDDVWAAFNLSVALYHIGSYEESVRAFETVEHRLPKRTLWYQIEPIRSYYELGRFDRVFEITDRILANGNRAFSELYVIRGNIHKTRGDAEGARMEYERAVRFNRNLKIAQNALDTCCNQ